MSKTQGLIIYKGKGIYWRYKSFKGNTFELHPHFEILAKDADSGEQVYWDNVVARGENVTGVKDFETLPEVVRTQVLDRCVEILEAKVSDHLKPEEQAKFEG